jgi:hypothetical protein
MNAQHGIYALGTPEHCFLELDLVDGVDPIELVRAAAGLTGPLSTIGGVNVVVGFRPQLWEQVAPDDAPAEVHSFDEDIVGPDGFTMPATQHDARRVLLFQLWPHDTPAWAAHPDDAQEKVIGRTKPDSIELSEKDMPDDSHVSRTVLEVNGVGRVRARRRKRLGDPVVPAVVWPAYRLR